MKLIISRHYFGKIYVDDKDELGLGPTDWVMLGARHIAGSVEGRFAVIEREAPKKTARRPGG